MTSDDSPQEERLKTIGAALIDVDSFVRLGAANRLPDIVVYSSSSNQAKYERLLFETMVVALDDDDSALAEELLSGFVEPRTSS